MLPVKILHMLFVISWMSALFYLPRILVHYSEGKAKNEDVRRLLIMGDKLNKFGIILAGVGIFTGGILWLYYGIGGDWLYMKLCIVLLLIAYHGFCVREFKRIKNNGLPRSGKFYRIYNELSVLMLLCILILVVVKPEF